MFLLDNSLNSTIYLLHSQTGLWLTAVAIVSLMAGSFINMFCYRLPIMLDWFESDEAEISELTKINLFYPRSFCPNCKVTITWWQNIPLISYLLLRGKCGHCKQVINISYFSIEVMTLVVSLITVVVIKDPVLSLWYILFTWLAITLAVLDLRYLLLPDGVNYALLWSGLLFSVTQGTASTAIVSAACAYVIFWGINASYKIVRKQDGIGQGDFKLVAGIGAWFAWYSLPNIILVASILGLLYALFKKVTATQSINQPVPFAPWLLLSSWFVLMYVSVQI